MKQKKYLVTIIVCIIVIIFSLLYRIFDLDISKISGSLFSVGEENETAAPADIEIEEDDKIELIPISNAETIIDIIGTENISGFQLQLKEYISSQGLTSNLATIDEASIISSNKAASFKMQLEGTDVNILCEYDRISLTPKFTQLITGN